ncbi:MAG: serine hydrolase domain-containing protein [Ruminococcus sp.]
MEKTPFLSPVSLDTLFCVGSVSKQFAAAAVMLLQEDGKLSVNDRLSRFFRIMHTGRI